ncbi:hypothetical protein M3Y94_00654100 [Aphelenchoides besseyi]|nr:hypothetical protein M3Y94_00654100 [Aphelenchoides besseyi]
MIVTPLNNFNFRIVRSIDGRPIENVELSLRLQENSTLDVPSTAHEHSQPPISIVPLNESHEVFNHSQQSRSLASRHSSQVNLAHMNENVPSSIHPTSTSIQAKPLIVQSPSTFTRNSIEDRTDRLYEHIVRVQIHSTVDGVSFSTEQPLHFFSHKPNSQIEVVEIWQNEKPLYRKLPSTSTPRSVLGIN